MAIIILDKEICAHNYTPTDCSLSGYWEFTRDAYFSVINQIADGGDITTILSIPMPTVSYVAGLGSTSIGGVTPSASCLYISASQNDTDGASSAVECTNPDFDPGNPICTEDPMNPICLPTYIGSYGFSMNLDFTFTLNLSNIYRDATDWETATKIWAPMSMGVYGNYSTFVCNNSGDFVETFSNWAGLGATADCISCPEGETPSAITSIGDSNYVWVCTGGAYNLIVTF